MARLPTVTCPECGAILESRDYAPNERGGAETASDYTSCLRRCEPCGIGLSNARTADTFRLARIDRDPFRQLPSFLRLGWYEAMDRALNVQNRRPKRDSFHSFSSEDQATWVVFRHLHREGALRVTLGSLGLSIAAESCSEPSLLLWGVPVPVDDAAGTDVRDRLIAILDHLRENPRSRSEPDVVLDFAGSGLVVIEVKHGSGNEVRHPTYPHWARYLSNTNAFRDALVTKDTGLYELCRNWRFGWELADTRPFTLINLGHMPLFAGEAGREVARFYRSLSIGDVRQFETITWTRFLAAMPDHPRWLRTYLHTRGLLEPEP